MNITRTQHEHNMNITKVPKVKNHCTFCSSSLKVITCYSGRRRRNRVFSIHAWFLVCGIRGGGRGCFVSGGRADEERAIFGHCQFKRASHPRNVGQIRRLFAPLPSERFEMMEQVLMGRLSCCWGISTAQGNCSSDVNELHYWSAQRMELALENFLLFGTRFMFSVFLNSTEE